MLLEIVVRAISLAIAGLFILAALHKAHVIRQGGASAEPLMRLSRWRRMYARPLLAAAAVAEVGVGALLLLVPLAGFACSGILAGAYAADLRRLPAGEPCNCFGVVALSQSRSGAMRRNGALVALSAAGFVAYGAGAVETAAISQEAFGVALVLAALIAAPAAVLALGRRNQLGREPQGERQPHLRGST